MKDKTPAILISALTLILLIGLFFLYRSQSPTSSSTGTSVGSMETDFTLKDLDNNSFTLSSFKGKEIVFLEFFAVWCPHCQRETTIINDLNSKYQEKSVKFVDVQASPYGKNYESSGDTTPATIADLKWFRDNFKVTPPILQDYSTATATTYNVQGFPTFYIIDKTGKIQYTNSGEVSETDLIKAIDNIVNKK